MWETYPEENISSPNAVLHVWVHIDLSPCQMLSVLIRQSRDGWYVEVKRRDVQEFKPCHKWLQCCLLTLGQWHESTPSIKTAIIYTTALQIRQLAMEGTLQVSCLHLADSR